MTFNFSYVHMLVYSYSTTNKMHLLSQIIFLVKRCTCFRRSFRPSSGAPNCVYSNDMCQTAAATYCYWGWDGTQFWAPDDRRKDRL